MRESIAQHYDNIHYMDAQVGEIMANLRADDLLDSTVVIWLTDHGDGLPRAKRSVYDSGLHIPMVIRSQQGKEAGGIDTRLISIVDLAPSILQLAGVPVPDFVQGQSMLDGEKVRDYVFAGRDRMDQVPDRARCEINGTNTCATTARSCRTFDHWLFATCFQLCRRFGLATRQAA